MERSGFVGIDVSRDCLDVAFRPSGKRAQVSNDRSGIARLIRMLERSKPELVVLEASGGYEIAALERLLAKQIPVALLNPRHVHSFARASGRLAKTDVIDAEVLAHFADVMKPSPTRLTDPETRALRAFVNRRQQLVHMVTAELHRSRCSLEVVRAGFAATLRCLKKEIASIDKQMASLIGRVSAFRQKAALLRNCAWHRRRCSSDAVGPLTRAR